MSTIVHLSDTHFGTELPAVVEAVQQAILAIAPDVIILSGDITQRARSSQFHAAAAFMDALPAKTKFVVPGNHDIPLFNMVARLLNPYGNYSHAFGLREGVWCLENIGIIGYNATSRWRHTRGQLSDADLVAHVRRARSQLKPGAILIATAHQPLVTAWPQDVENILIDAERTAQLFAENGVDVVLSGHVHVPLIATTETMFPTLPRHFILSGAGTAISHRTRPGAPNSFNVITVATDQPRIAIRLMEFDSTTQQFAEKMDVPFTLEASGWHKAA